MRICFVTSRFPYPAIKGDTVRVFHQLQALSRRHQLTLVSLHDRPLSREQMGPIAELCEQVHVVPHPRWRAALRTAAGLVRRDPLQVSYFRSEPFGTRLEKVLRGGKFDALHVSLIRMVPYAWTLGAGAPVVVVDLIDSISLNLLSRRGQAAGPMRLLYGLEYARVRALERAVARRFSRLVISSPVDRELLGAPAAQVVPNGVDLDRFPFQPPEGRDPETLIFTGNMAYPPNEEAALWFARRVWPLLRSKWPGLRLEIAGASPSARLRALERDERIAVPGFVPSMAERLGRATVSLCPLQSGSGIQNKVLEAMAVGTPVVSTTVGNQGLQAVPGRDLLLADTPEEFAASVDLLLGDAERRARMATYGRAFVEERFQWDTHARALEALYAGDPPPPGRHLIPQEGARERLIAGRCAANAIAELRGGGDPSGPAPTRRTPA